jgi:hypothetical protein
METMEKKYYCRSSLILLKSRETAVEMPMVGGSVGKSREIRSVVLLVSREMAMEMPMVGGAVEEQRDSHGNADGRWIC